MIARKCDACVNKWTSFPSSAYARWVQRSVGMIPAYKEKAERPVRADPPRVGKMWSGLYPGRGVGQTIDDAPPARPLTEEASPPWREPRP